VDRFLQTTPVRRFTFGASICSVASLIVSLVVWSQVAAAAEVASCVVKLKFSSDQRADSATDAYVRQVLAQQGYKVVDDWLFTMWTHSNYEVKVTITHTLLANFGFPTDLMGMQLYIADASGNVLVDAYIDRSILAANLQASIPACNAAPSPTPLPVSTSSSDRASSTQQPGLRQ
jgi:hypothetical protein